MLAVITEMPKIKWWISSIESPTQRSEGQIHLTQHTRSPRTRCVCAASAHFPPAQKSGAAPARGEGHVSSQKPPVRVFHNSGQNAFTKWNGNKSMISVPHLATQWTRSLVTYLVTAESISPLGGIKCGQLCVYCRKGKTGIWKKETHYIYSFFMTKYLLS